MANAQTPSGAMANFNRRPVPQNVVSVPQDRRSSLMRAVLSRLGGAQQATNQNPYRSLQTAASRRVGG